MPLNNSQIGKALAKYHSGLPIEDDELSAAVEWLHGACVVLDAVCLRHAFSMPEYRVAVKAMRRALDNMREMDSARRALKQASRETGSEVDSVAGLVVEPAADSDQSSPLE